MSFSSAHRGNHKVEDACEMYARAANMFKMAKNWSGRWHVCMHARCVYHKLMSQNKRRLNFHTRKYEKLILILLAHAAIISINVVQI